MKISTTPFYLSSQLALCSALGNNKKYTPIDLFTNRKDYVLEDDYEVLTVHINENLRIYFEKIGEKNQIKIQLSLENGIPNTYFEEYLNEIDKIITSVSLCK